MEQEKFKHILRTKGLKVTNQRMLILNLMAKHPGEHLTAEELYDLAKQECPEIGLATIYRTVQVLVDLSVIDKVRFNDGFARYELGGLTRESGHHHHHAICSRCGKVYSFRGDLLDTLEQALYDREGFIVTDHEVKLYGYCRECREATKRGQDGNDKMEVKD
ncbi:Fur family transcriptional regulator [Clostridium sp. E02]|uniref:Fur family transcriptional regulator n=1 Tax=Clostridium sp. E02 TaxID=2487134 RepID=UPI0019D15890|nr:Fur family transcriptional regulator [Clostridium sp. E02]